MRLLRSVSRTTDLDHVAPHASAPCIRINHLAPSEGRQKTKARSGKSYIDAKMQMSAKLQCVTKLRRNCHHQPSRLFLRHSTLDEQCFSRVVRLLTMMHSRLLVDSPKFLGGIVKAFL
jgi:hypothetical protein